MNQAFRSAKLATNDKALIKKVLDEVGDMIKTIPMESTPPETGVRIYEKIGEITGNNDTYKEIKKANIAEALSLVPMLEEIVRKSEDSLLTALRIAIAGNVIDLGVNKAFNIKEDIHKILNQDFGIFHYKDLKEALKNADKVLYVGDNAGESVFDKILIDQLDCTVDFAVRDKPIINDCVVEDALDSGLDGSATIFSSGCPAPAAILRMCNEKFLHKFKEADLVISKGQGNYEGLSDVERPVFFMLKAKCKVIARNLGVQEDDIVLKGININQ